MSTSDNPFPAYVNTPDPGQAAALASNRAGALTPEQKQSLRRQLLTRVAGSVLAAVIVPTIGLCFGGIVLASSSDFNDLEGALIMLGVFGLLFGVFAVWAAIHGFRPALGLLDVSAGRLEQADGRLVWRGRSYRGAVEGRGDLHLLPGAEQAPGAHRFYFLPRSGYIVTTERLFLGGTEADTRAELLRALGDEFNFVEDDLPENRVGHLSGRQRTAIFFSQLRSALVMLSIVGMTACFAVLIPAAFLLEPVAQGEPFEASALWPAAVAALVGVILLAVLGWQVVRLLQDLAGGEVKMTQGRVEERTLVTGSGKNRRTRYYYVVNDERFEVHPVAHQALIQDREYRLYYLPRTRRIVSVEPV